MKTDRIHLVFLRWDLLGAFRTKAAADRCARAARKQTRDPKAGAAYGLTVKVETVTVQE